MLICSDLRTGVGCGAINPNGMSTCGRCNNPLRYAIELHDPGDIIGRYRVQTMIGHGGFGAVYAVESLQRPGLLLALKETFDPASIRSLQNEFTILQSLSHPTLPRYYEWFEHQGSGYLVMELVEGQNLEEILVRRRGPLPEPQVLGYAVQLCDVLSYLHTRHSPILHRDIKPANIRLTPDGLIKLVDFGLIKQGTQTTRMTMRGVGTLAYAPVEQYGGDGQHTDQRSDLYSLGATLYHLLSGQEPLSAGKRLATVDPLLPMRQVNSAIAPHVSAAVTRAMQPLLDQRYPDMARFKAALLDATSGVHVPPAIAPTIPIARPVAVAPITVPAPPAIAPTPPIARPVAVATAPIPLPPVARPPTPIQSNPPSVAKRSSPLTIFLGAGEAVLIALIVLGACLAVLIAVIALGEGRNGQTAVQPTATSAPTPLPAWVPELVEVPAGPFLMGSTDQQIADAISQGASAYWTANEKPQHTLILPTYWIGKTEVTNAQFRRFVESDGYTNQTYWDSAGWQWRTEQKRTQPSCWSDAQWNGDTQPVVCVTWYEAMAYTRWLSAQMGQTFSLPTEAEWEKAARGPDGLIYPWGTTWQAGRANSSEAGVGKTTPVGQYPSGASPYKVMDMAGNVWEWTRSVHTPYPYNPTDGREDLRDLAGKFFTLRGGAWRNLPIFLHAAARLVSTPDYLDQNVGFRLARHL